MAMARARNLIVAIALAGLIHAIITVFHLPVYGWLPRWTWKFTHIENPDYGAVPRAAVVAAVAYLAATWRFEPSQRFPFLRVALLTFCAFAFQLQVQFIEGRGLEPIRDQMRKSGHAQFAMAAVQEPSIWDVLTHYEAKAQSKEIGLYARSKPPGTFLTYLISDRIANGLTSPNPPPDRNPQDYFEDRAENLVRFSGLVWPAIASLAIFPLVALGMLLAGPATALRAAAFYVVVPSFVLVQLHTDQTFFPLFTLVCVLLGWIAAKRKSVPLSMLTGAMVGCSALFQYPLSLLLGIIGCAIVYEAGVTKRAAMMIAASAAGFVAIIGAFQLATGFEFIPSLRAAAEFSYRWQIHGAHVDVLPLKTRILGMGTNIVEFTAYFGTAVSILACVAFVRSVQSARQRTLAPVQVLMLALGALIAFLILRGDALSEVCRLWLFLMPMLCISAASVVDSLDAKEGRNVGITAFAVQFATVVLLKMNQDF